MIATIRQALDLYFEEVCDGDGDRTGLFICIPAYSTWHKSMTPSPLGIDKSLRFSGFYSHQAIVTVASKTLGNNMTLTFYFLSSVLFRPMK